MKIIREKVHFVLVAAKTPKVQKRLSDYIDLCKEAYGDEVNKFEPIVIVPPELEDTLIEYLYEEEPPGQEHQRPLFERESA